MLERRADRIAALIVLGMVAVGLYGLVALPPEAKIAIHFDASGRPDAWTHSRWALFALPMLALVLWGLFALLPRLERERENLMRSQPALDVIALATLALLAALQVLTVATSLGTLQLPPNSYLVALGLLFVAMGNVMGKLRPNHSVGIRTRWTLAHDRVWDQTHRFGGKVFVVAGAALALLPALPFARGHEGVLILVITLAAGALPVVKSYRLWRELPPGSPPAGG